MSDRARRSHSKDSGVSANNASLDNSAMSDFLGSLSNGNKKLSVKVSLPRTEAIDRFLKVGVRKGTRSEVEAPRLICGSDHEALDFEFETSPTMEEEVSSTDKSIVKKASSSPHAASIKSNQSNFDRNFGHRTKYLQRVEVADSASSFRRNYLPYMTSNLDSDSQTATFIDSSDDEDGLLDTDDENDGLTNTSKTCVSEEDGLLNDSGNNSTTSKNLYGDSEESSADELVQNKDTSWSNSDVVNNNKESVNKIKQPILKNVSSTVPSNFSITLNVSSDKRNVVPKTVPNVKSFNNKSENLWRRRLIRKRRVNIEPENEYCSDSSDQSLNNTSMKKKKWDLKFETKTPKLTLCDTPVKYITEEEVPVAASTTSNLKVTFIGKEKIVVDPRTDKLGLFKRPLKRPPTRQKPKSQGSDDLNTSPSRNLNSNNFSAANLKFTITNTKSLNQNPVESDKPDITDDVISLLGSTAIYDTDDDKEPVFKTEPSESDFKAGPQEEQAKQLQANCEAKVQEWMKTRVLSSSGSLNNNEDALSRPIDIQGIRNVPPIFRGFCFRYFFGECRFNRCMRSHVLNGPRFLKVLREATLENLRIGYKYAVLHKKFFEVSYIYFATIFGEKGMCTEVVSVLEDVFNLNLDILKGVNVVLDSLKKSDKDMSHEVAVDYLNAHSKILYDIIHKRPIRENWQAVMKLTSGTNKLDFQLGCNLINLVTSLGDTKLCKDVFQHIVGKNKIHNFCNITEKSNMVELRKLALEFEKNTEQGELGAIIQERLEKGRASVELEQIQKQRNSQILEELCAEQNSFKRKTITFEPPQRVVEQPGYFTAGNCNTSSFVRAPQWTVNNESTPLPLIGQRLTGCPKVPTPPVSTRPLGQYLEMPPPLIPTRQESFAPYSESVVSNRQGPFAQSSKMRPPLASTREGMFAQYSGMSTPPVSIRQGSFVQYSDLRPPPVPVRQGPSAQYSEGSAQSRSDTLANDGTPTERQIPDRNSDSFTNMQGSNRRSGKEDIDGTLPLTPRVRQYEYFSSEDEFPMGDSRSQHGAYLNRSYETDSNASTSTQRLSYSPLSALIPPRLPMAYNRHGNTYDPQGDYIPLPKKSKSKDSSPVQMPSTNGKSSSVTSDSQDGILNVEAKPPEKPAFGKLQLGASYELEVSLHVLYTEDTKRVDIDECDVLKLNATILTGDGYVYLQLLEKYKHPATIQNFVTMSIAHLKGMNQMVFKVYMKLLESIEKANPYYYGNTKIRVILEVVTLNILYELEKRVMWEQALQLLEKFTNWDTLITSRVCDEPPRGGLFERYQSLMGRYFFIANILVYANKYYSLSLAYELLQCPSIHLLEAPEKWPFSCPNGIEADIKLRDKVLREFFRAGYLTNVAVVDQMYKKAKQGEIYEYESMIHISPMVNNLINMNNVVTLKQLFSADMDLYTHFLEKQNLRATFCLLCDNLGVEDAFKLYDKCVERGIYRELKGSELNITLWTNMLDQEIEFIFKYYFSKMTQAKSVPTTNLKIAIEQPPKTSIVKYPRILDVMRSVQEVHLKLKELLNNKYKIYIVKSITHSQLEIDVDALRSFLIDEDDAASVFM